MGWVTLRFWIGKAAAYLIRWTILYLMRIADGRRFGWYFSFQPELDVELSTLAQICTVSHIKLDDIIIVTKIVPCKVSSGFRLWVLGHSTKFIALLA